MFSLLFFYISSDNFSFFRLACDCRGLSFTPTFGPTVGQKVSDIRRNCRNVRQFRRSSLSLSTARSLSRSLTHLLSLSFLFLNLQFSHLKGTCWWEIACLKKKRQRERVSKRARDIEREKNREREIEIDRERER